MIFQYQARAETVPPPSPVPIPDAGGFQPSRPIRRTLATALMFAASVSPVQPPRTIDATDCHSAIVQRVPRATPRFPGISLEDPQGPLPVVVLTLPYWHGNNVQPAAAPKRRIAGQSIEDPTGPLRAVGAGDWLASLVTPQRNRQRPQGASLEDPQGPLPVAAVTLPYWHGAIEQPRRVKPRSPGWIIEDPAGPLRIVNLTDWSQPTVRPPQRLLPLGTMGDEAFVIIVNAPASTGETSWFYRLFL